MILLFVQCAWISVYATWFCKHGLYQRRGQGAYCRPGGCSQNMFIDVHEILHMFMMFLNVHPDAIVFQYKTITISLFVQCAWISVYATWFCKHGLYQTRGQGAYCRPGGCSQHMFIDVDEILHMFMVFVNVHHDAIIL